MTKRQKEDVAKAEEIQDEITEAAVADVAEDTLEPEAASGYAAELLRVAWVEEVAAETVAPITPKPEAPAKPETVYAAVEKAELPGTKSGQIVKVWETFQKLGMATAVEVADKVVADGLYTCKPPAIKPVRVWMRYFQESKFATIVTPEDAAG